MNIMEATILSLSLFIGIINGIPIDSTENVSPCGNTTCHPVKINGHIVPRSQDDVGIYYQVQHIISSVGSASTENHNTSRRFIQAATSIFFTWWNEQDELIKSQMRQLINEGQIEIVNGSWSMNDEGAVHYQSSMDQYTLGLIFIEDTLEKYARLSVSWQIDAFGRSREQASLTSQLGMGAVFFARLDYRDKRQKEKSLDMIWTRSDNLGTATTIKRATMETTVTATVTATGTGPVTVTKTGTGTGTGTITATATASGTATATAIATSVGRGAATATATASGTSTATARATSSAAGATTARVTSSGTAPGTATATSTGAGAATATTTSWGTSRATAMGAGAATAAATGSTRASATAIATATATKAATATATATDHDVIEEITT